MQLPPCNCHHAIYAHAPNGRPDSLIAALTGWSLPRRMKDSVKEFHLVADPVARKIAPAMTANLWGYNGQSPGPTTGAAEGARICTVVTDKLPEVTSVHWHSILLPSGMGGVTGLTQSPIAVGKPCLYPFVLQRAGTFMHHPHGDEMMRMAMGRMGPAAMQAWTQCPTQSRHGHRQPAAQSDGRRWTAMNAMQ